MRIGARLLPPEIVSQFSKTPPDQLESQYKIDVRGNILSVTEHISGVDSPTASASSPPSSSSSSVNVKQMQIHSFFSPEDPNKTVYDEFVRPIVTEVSAGVAMEGVVVIDGCPLSKVATLYHEREGFFRLTLADLKAHPGVADVFISYAELQGDYFVDVFDPTRNVRVVEDPLLYFTNFEGLSLNPCNADTMQIVDGSFDERRHQVISFHIQHFSPLPHRGAGGNSPPRSMTVVHFIQLAVNDGNSGSRTSGGSFRAATITARQTLNQLAVSVSEQSKPNFNGSKLSFLLKPAFLAQEPACWLTLFMPYSPVSEGGFKETFREAQMLALLGGRVSAAAGRNFPLSVMRQTSVGSTLTTNKEAPKPIQNASSNRQLIQKSATTSSSSPLRGSSQSPLSLKQQRTGSRSQLSAAGNKTPPTSPKVQQQQPSHLKSDATKQFNMAEFYSPAPEPRNAHPAPMPTSQQQGPADITPNKLNAVIREASASRSPVRTTSQEEKGINKTIAVAQSTPPATQFSSSGTGLKKKPSSLAMKPQQQPTAVPKATATATPKANPVGFLAPSDQLEIATLRQQVQRLEAERVEDKERLQEFSGRFFEMNQRQEMKKGTTTTNLNGSYLQAQQQASGQRKPSTPSGQSKGNERWATSGARSGGNNQTAVEYQGGGEGVRGQTPTPAAQPGWDNTKSKKGATPQQQTPANSKVSFQGNVKAAISNGQAQNNTSTAVSVSLRNEYQIYKEAMEGAVLRLRSDLDLQLANVTDLQKYNSKKEKQVKSLQNEVLELTKDLQTATKKVDQLEAIRQQLEGEHLEEMSVAEHYRHQDGDRLHQVERNNKELKECLQDATFKNTQLQENVEILQRKMNNAQRKSMMKQDGQTQTQQSDAVALPDGRSIVGCVPRSTQTLETGFEMDEEMYYLKAENAKLSQQWREEQTSRQKLEESCHALTSRLYEVEGELQEREESELMLKTNMLRLEQMLRERPMLTMEQQKILQSKQKCGAVMETAVVQTDETCFPPMENPTGGAEGNTSYQCVAKRIESVELAVLREANQGLQLAVQELEGKVKQSEKEIYKLRENSGKKKLPQQANAAIQCAIEQLKGAPSSMQQPTGMKSVMQPPPPENSLLPQHPPIASRNGGGDLSQSKPSTTRLSPTTMIRKSPFEEGDEEAGEGRKSTSRPMISPVAVSSPTQQREKSSSVPRQQQRNTNSPFVMSPMQSPAQQKSNPSSRGKGTEEEGSPKAITAETKGGAAASPTSTNKNNTKSAPPIVQGSPISSPPSKSQPWYRRQPPPGQSSKYQLTEDNEKMLDEAILKHSQRNLKAGLQK